MCVRGGCRDVNAPERGRRGRGRGGGRGEGKGHSGWIVMARDCDGMGREFSSRNALMHSALAFVPPGCPGRAPRRGGETRLCSVQMLHINLKHANGPQRTARHSLGGRAPLFPSPDVTLRNFDLGRTAPPLRWCLVATHSHYRRERGPRVAALAGSHGETFLDLSLPHVVSHLSLNSI